MPQPVLTVRMVESQATLTAWAFMRDPYRLQLMQWDDATERWHLAKQYDCESTLFGINPDYPVLLVQNAEEQRRVLLVDIAGDQVLSAELPKHILPTSFVYDPNADQLYVANYYGRVWRYGKSRHWSEVVQLPTESPILSMDIAPGDGRLFLAAEDAYVVDTVSGRILLRLNDEDHANFTLKIRWDQATRTLHALTTDRARTWGNRRSVVLR
jgi:hypothetical protein